MNLEYLQETHTFHVERIMDFLAHNLPLCAIHQTRTIIFFCYLFALLIEFLLYPPYSVGNTPFTLTTLFLPLIIVVALHIILTVCYIFGALFERASWKTGLGLMFFFHASIPIVVAIGAIILGTSNNVKNYYFSYSIVVTVSVFLDFLCGVISRPSQVIILSFEIMAVVPASILASLYFNGNVRQVWAPFLPPFIYFGLYFSMLLLLAPCCGIFRNCALKILSDPEIAVEFIAAVDPQLKPFKTRADWVDEPDALGSDHGGFGGYSGFSTAYNNGAIGNAGINGAGAGMNGGLGGGSLGGGGGRGRHEARASRWSRQQEGDVITRFPSRADFQLYNVDATPENPLYLASPLPMLALAVLLSVFLVHCLSPLANFYFLLAGAAVLLVLAVLLNSRATACSFLAFTNLDDKCVDILWDHPGLSLL
ncbi:hypothetical protein TRFO_31141 [Tritrichomonas foetus]|uniref:Uncharacterized protein n=1 Tax=Tritrichomonas foetus TaxID=1144522 RepID=A0A1J4JT80_9EUKA|nr:hypothetical protein TRFO_31141 [Tritrichomonas foetus]|eukprot:OHT01946.1 hypothetical protein TRFO_31141 [Tritrichomonas foetus]